MQNVRHGRLALFRNPSTPGGTPSRADSGTDLGTFACGGYSRFVGMLSSVGSFTLQWRLRCHSGNFPGDIIHRDQQRQLCFPCRELWPLREFCHHC